MTDKKIVELKHTNISAGKNAIQTMLDQPTYNVPRLSIEIVRNRWRALTTGFLIQLDPEIAKFVKAALQSIASTDIIIDQRDIYYSIRMGHPDWKLAGHELKSEEAYNTFVGQIMEKLQLATGYTMQSLGVRAGPRGYITGDDRSYFILPDGRNIPVNANPVIQFNLVDEGVELHTQAHKLIHYEKAAGLNSLVINQLPLMLEMLVMTSQGYNVEAATKMHRDMENRGLKLYVLGDADPHGLEIQLMYGRASKSNAYMPESFYPKSACLLGLNPRIAKLLNLPPEQITDVHMKIIPNLEKLVRETNPDMEQDVEILKNDRTQWEWQSLNGLDPYAPAVYEIEALRAVGDDMKYVPQPLVVKETITRIISPMVEKFVNDKINDFAREWLLDNLYPELVEQIKKDLEGDIEEYKRMADEELEKLRTMKDEDIREAIKLKLVKNPKQYWTDAIRKVVSDILTQKFNITARVMGSVDTEGSTQVTKDIEIAIPEVPPQPLTKDDITESIEKQVVSGKKGFNLIQKIRNAIESRFGKPDMKW